MYTARRLEGKRIIVLNCNILMKKCIFGELQKHQNKKFFFSGVSHGNLKRKVIAVNKTKISKEYLVMFMSL